MRPSLTLLLCLAATAFVRAEVPAQKTELLHDREFSGWECVNPEKTPINVMCEFRPGGVIAVAGAPIGYIATTASYENYQLHAEWRWSGKAGNSGVLLHISDGPMDRVWPVSFQVQTKNKRVGDLLPMSAAKFVDPLSTPPGAKTPQLDRRNADSEKPVGEWNSCDILCRGGVIEVTINGVAQNRVTGCVPSSGKVGFQLEGVPYELRNVWIDRAPRAIGSSPQFDPPAKTR